MSYVDLGNPISSAFLAKLTPKAGSISTKKLKSFSQRPDVSRILSYNTATMRYNKGEAFRFSKNTSALLSSFSFRNVEESRKQRNTNKKLNNLKKTLNKTKLYQNREFKKSLDALPLTEEQKSVISRNPGDAFVGLMTIVSKKALVEFIQDVRNSVKSKRPSNRYYVEAEGRRRLVTIAPSENQDIFRLFLQLTCVVSEHPVEAYAQSLLFAAEQGTAGIVNSVEDLLQFGGDVATGVSETLGKISENTASALAEGVEKASEAASDAAQAAQAFVEESVEAVKDFGEDVVSFFGLGEPVTLAAIGLAAVGLLLTFALVVALILVFGDFFKGFFWKASFEEDMPEGYLTDAATKESLNTSVKVATAGAVAVGAITAAGGAAAGVQGAGLLETASVQNGTSGTFTPQNQPSSPSTSSDVGSQESSSLLLPGLAVAGLAAYLLLSKRGNK